MQARTPADVARKIFLIATEESGDRLGANLMKVLRQRLGGAVRFEGVGGRAMLQEGLTSLFPIEELSIVGLAAVVRQLPKILRLIRRTADAVAKAAPDILVIIDSPDFTLRVAKRVRARDAAIRSSTTYRRRSGRGGRAGHARCRRYIDHVLALLPFEPDAYRKLNGPPCSYVGHPLVEQPQRCGLLPANKSAAMKRRRYCWCCPAGRRSEIRHHMAVFGETLGRLHQQGVPFELILPTMPHLQKAVMAGTRSWPVQPRVVIGEQEKKAAFRVAHAALVKSGTATLELALSGVPMVAAYKAGSLEAWIVLSAVRVSSVILANLVIGENVVPEFIQQDCTPEKLVPALREILGDSTLRRRQVEAFAKLDSIMSTGDQPPSVRAAGIVLATMRKSRRAS